MMMTICRLLVLLPACRAGEEDAMLQMTAANSLEAEASSSTSCPQVPPGFLPSQAGWTAESQCANYLEICLASKMPIRQRKRWRHNWRNGPKTFDHWMRDSWGGNGVDAMQQTMRRCGEVYCCGGNHRFDSDQICQNEMHTNSLLSDRNLQKIHKFSVQLNTYPLAIVSRGLCSRIKYKIVSPNVGLTQLDDTVTGGKGDQGSNMSLVSLATTTSCWNPVNTNPESWGCSCHLQMKKRCEAIEPKMQEIGANEQDCFKAQMCHAQSPVCDGWKTHGNCWWSSAVMQLQGPLTSHMGLVQRAGLLQKQEQSDVTKALMGLDESVKGKSCV